MTRRQQINNDSADSSAESTGATASTRSGVPSPFAAPAIRMLETRLEASVECTSRQPVRCALDVCRLLRELVGAADREHFVALYLNTRHVVTHAHVVSRGTTQTAPVHPREVFKGAYLANAAALIVAHNHPSGDVSPSSDDRAVTNRLREAGELLGVELLDSLIVGPGRQFYSAAEDRILTDSTADSLEVADGS